MNETTVGGVRVTRVPVGEMAENCYVVGREGGGDAFLVDPGDEPDAIRAALAGRRVAAVLLTHAHFDHIGAVDALADGAPVYAHALDIPALTDPRLNVSAMLGKPVTVAAPALPLAEGDALVLAGVPVTVWHTPGHTAGGLSFLVGADDVLTGDTLFADGYGRTDFPGGDSRALMTSLRRLMIGCAGRTAHPGHGASVRLRPVLRG